MADNRTRISEGFQGAYLDEKPFLLVGVVRDDMDSQVLNLAGIENSKNKHFLLCACTLKDTDDILLYLSNDPTDFFYNSTTLINNHGVVPFRKTDDLLKIDIQKNHVSETIHLPKNHPFKLSDKTEYNEIEFSFVENNQITNKIHYGIPLKIKYGDDSRINFYMRKNVPVSQTGRIGPSIASFTSDVFEPLRTISFAREGTSFTFDTDTKLFGMSRLLADTPTKPFTSLGAATNSGIIQISQGSSLAYNIFHNPSGVSDIYLNYDSGYDFLNKTFFNPDPANGGISVQINIRNSSENFLSINAITPGVSEVFDYYLINPTDFTSGGLVNNSTQYIESNGDISGGISVFFDKSFFYYNSLANENTKGLPHAIQILNGTPTCTTTTNNDILSDNHAPCHTVYSNGYDSTIAINYTRFNSTDSNNDNGRVRQLNSSKGYSNVFQDSAKNLDHPTKPLFTTNPKKGQNTFLVEFIIMGIFLAIYLLFTIYYLNLKVLPSKEADEINKN